MNDKNYYMPQSQTQMQQQGYYPYYQSPIVSNLRPDTTSYMMQQPVQVPILRGRPVSSLEEARVAQIDLDGSTFIFPSLANKKIYTKRINADGTATLNSYSLDNLPVEEEKTYATKNELEELKTTLAEILNKIQNAADSNKPKINF